MKKLNELDDGSCGTIVAITGDSHFQSRITSIGLTIGSRIEVINGCYVCLANGLLCIWNQPCFRIYGGHRVYGPYLLCV